MLVIGVAVGLMIGLTGIGSGSLLTPMLILFAGMSPAGAVGTSLWFSLLTKLYGGYKFYRRGLVKMDIVRDLSIGSLPGAVLGALVVRYLGVRHPESMNGVVLRAIGIALIVVSALMILRMLPHRYRAQVDRPLPFSDRQRRMLIWLTGFCVGISVAVTSIGSGAALIPAMVLFYHMDPGVLVGTNVFVGALLAAVAGIPHAGLGNVDWHAVVALLCGSIPTIWLSSHFHGWVPRRIAESIIAGALMIMGLHIVAF